MQKITVPYRITRRQQVAYLPLYQRGIEGDLLAAAPFTGAIVVESGLSPSSCVIASAAKQSLFDEVMGYGGSSCLTSFNITTKGTAVICPNTANQRVVEKTTSYTVGVPKECPTGTTSTEGTYIPPSSYTAGGSTQTSGGSITGSPPAPIDTGDPCNCKEEGSQIQGEPCKECKGGTTTNKADGQVAVVAGTECKECMEGVEVNCGCKDLTDEYKDYAGKHQDDVYHTIAESLSCVADDLCKNSKTYDDPKWLSNIMSCLNDKWEVKGSKCWQEAVKLCDKFPNNYNGKLGCFIAQINCHWGEDLNDCEGLYGSGTGWDEEKTWWPVLRCIPTFFQSLYW